MRNPDNEAGQVTLEPAAHFGCAGMKLSHRERLRFERALEILAGGVGAVALGQAGIVVSGPGIFAALLARAWAVRHSDPAEMLRLANAALDVASRLNPRYGERFVADLQARAWGELANACRIAGRLDTATRALDQALHLSQGTGDKLLGAWLIEVNANLAGCSGKPALAVELLAVCRHLYDELGERHLAGRVLVTQAVFVYAGGEPFRALHLNEEGSSQLDPAREPDLLALAAHHHGIFEAALGRCYRSPESVEI